jgi:hypothetical protein
MAGGGPETAVNGAHHAEEEAFLVEVAGGSSSKRVVDILSVEAMPLPSSDDDGGHGRW